MITVTLRDYHFSTLIIVWSGHESLESFHTNSRLSTLINSNADLVLIWPGHKLRKFSYQLSLVNPHQLSCNSCSRFTRTWELRKLLHKLSLVNFSHSRLTRGFVLWVNMIMLHEIVNGTDCYGGTSQQSLTLLPLSGQENQTLMQGNWFFCFHLKHRHVYCIRIRSEWGTQLSHAYIQTLSWIIEDAVQLSLIKGFLNVPVVTLWLRSHPVSSLLVW